MSSSMYISPTYSKPLAAGVIAAVLDRMLLKNDNAMENFYFGVSAGLGTFVGTLANPYVPAIIPDSSFGNGQILTSRVADIGISALTGYAINKYAVSNDFGGAGITMRLGVLAIADFGSEYIADYLSATPLSYLS